MNIREAVDLLKKEQQFVQHEMTAHKRRIGVALLSKRLGYPAESTDKLHAELKAFETRLDDIALMIEAAPDVQTILVDRHGNKTEAPIVGIENLRNEYLAAKKNFKNGFRAMRDDEPRLASSAVQVMKLARAARQSNDARAFLKPYIDQNPVINRAFR